MALDETNTTDSACGDFVLPSLEMTLPLNISPYTAAPPGASHEMVRLLFLCKPEMSHCY